VQDLSLKNIILLFKWSRAFSLMSQEELSKTALLKEAVVANLFFENSTRTELSFQIAAEKLGAKTVNLNVQKSSLAKGETLLDTALNIEAFGCNLLVVRHHENGILNFLANNIKIGIINAGDGDNEHPTQALLDAFTLYEHFSRTPSNLLQDLNVSIIGDIKHSRVAKSNMKLLPLLGAKVTVFGPKEFMPDDINNYMVSVASTFDEAVKNANAVMMLRIQKERFLTLDAIPEAVDYFNQFGLSLSRFNMLSNKSVVMHPGPINRGVEIASEVAEHERSLILLQARNGVFMRMAILHGLFQTQKKKEKNFSEKSEK
ncbi:MAG: aspartate carbamoyltransferase catalytic subunit, partial [bacterium]|nr:aspartate carbamoyltransferase catalytic subunit [bacterium]